MNTGNRSINELAKACAHSTDAHEWEEFLERCTPVVSAVVAHITRRWTGTASSSHVLDIAQEVFLRLCERDRRILREFEPHGDTSFFGLLRVIAASVANDYFRRQHSAKRGGQLAITALDELAPGAMPSSGPATANMHRDLLLSEIDHHLMRAADVFSNRDRAIFWLYYRHGLTAEEIAGLPSVHLSPKGVESVLRRVTTWLNRAMQPAGTMTIPLPAKETI